MINDIQALDKKVAKIKSNIDSVGSDFKRQMKGFIEVRLDHLLCFFEHLYIPFPFHAPPSKKRGYIALHLSVSRSVSVVYNLFQ